MSTESHSIGESGAYGGRHAACLRRISALEMCAAGQPQPLEPMSWSRFSGCFLPFNYLEMIVRNVVSALILLSVSVPALALPTVDEPSTFAFMALAAVASLVIARRRK